MEITYYHVPYDLDLIWDGGCNGSDLFRDHFGDTVHLFTSDTGSAYVCPEKVDADWRLYVDSYGRVRRLTAKPGEAQQVKPYKKMRSLYDDIRRCGLTVYPNLPMPSRDGEGAPPVLPEEVDYLSADLGSLPFFIRFDEVTVGAGEGEISFADDGLVWGERYERAIFASDPGYEIRDKLFPYLLPPREIEAKRASFAKRRESADGFAASLLIFLDGLLSRSLSVHEEIFEFERACKALVE